MIEITQLEFNSKLFIKRLGNFPNQGNYPLTKENFLAKLKQ